MSTNHNNYLKRWERRSGETSRCRPLTSPAQLTLSYAVCSVRHARPKRVTDRLTPYRQAKAGHRDRLTDAAARVLYGMSCLTTCYIPSLAFRHLPRKDVVNQYFEFDHVPVLSSTRRHCTWARNSLQLSTGPRGQ